jgi:hypothetical protein
MAFPHLLGYHLKAVNPSLSENAIPPSFVWAVDEGQCMHIGCLFRALPHPQTSRKDSSMMDQPLGLGLKSGFYFECRDWTGRVSAFKKGWAATG